MSALTQYAIRGSSASELVRSIESGVASGALAPGELELQRVTPAGGREMDAASYLRGHGVPVAG